MVREKINGVCIKRYADEEDLLDYEEGLISNSDIRFYEVGDESLIVKGYYNKEYWEPKK
jgi:hypothetical protein